MAEAKSAVRNPPPEVGTEAQRLEIDQRLCDRGSVLLVLSGQIDANTFHALSLAIKSLFQQQRYRIILDCSAVLYIASAGIGAIINAMAEAQANKGNVVVMNPSPGAQRTLLLFGLHEVVPMAGDKNAAVGYFA
jgi:anti-sigma B factor antagonist